MNLLIIIVVAVSLSMDAFSLALLYGTLNFKKKTIISLSIIVGLFHFFMPLIGVLIRLFIENFVSSYLDLITLIIFCYIGLDMIFTNDSEVKSISELSYKEQLLFGLAVSIDSLSIGISLVNNYLLSAFIFSIFSCLFTYMGLLLGKKINHIFGKISTIIGGIILIILGIIFFIY